MAEQTSLFPLPAAAPTRRADPPTSKRAAERADALDLVGRHEKLILASAVDHPGRTGNELGELTGLGQVKVCRRLKRLEEHGWIVREDTGGRELVVYPTAMARSHRPRL